MFQTTPRTGSPSYIKIRQNVFHIIRDCSRCPSHIHKLLHSLFQTTHSCVKKEMWKKFSLWPSLFPKERTLLFWKQVLGREVIAGSCYHVSTHPRLSFFLQACGIMNRSARCRVNIPSHCCRISSAVVS